MSVLVKRCSKSSYEAQKPDGMCNYVTFTLPRRTFVIRTNPIVVQTRDARVPFEDWINVGLTERAQSFYSTVGVVDTNGGRNRSRI